MTNLIWLNPEPAEAGDSPAIQWRTQCGRYRVARVGGPYPRFAAMKRLGPLMLTEATIKDDMGRLDAALDAAEREAAEDAGARRIDSNREAIEAMATRDKLERRPPVDDHLPPDVVLRRRASLDRFLEKKRAQESEPTELPRAQRTGERANTKPAANGIHKTEGNIPMALKPSGYPRATKPKKKVPLHAEKAKADKLAREAEYEAANANPKAKGDTPANEKKLSAINAAHQVLVKAGQPMTAQEMIDAMAAAGLWTSPGGKTPSATLYSSILREIQTKGQASRFIKADRGKFSAKS